MKRIVSLTAALAVVLLTGCVTLSVYPYYTTKDIQFDPALLGVWVDPDQTNSNRESWSFEKLGAQSYRLTLTENDKRTEFHAHLFKIKGHLFLDCLPREHSEFSAPCHFLLRVDRIGSTFETRPLSYEWLGNLLEEQPEAIRHTIVTQPTAPKGDEKKTLVLTADTAELQKFILKHIQTREAWKDSLVMKRS